MPPAFLPNHAHFFFRTGEISITALMRRLLTGYVVSFNRRHKRQPQTGVILTRDLLYRSAFPEIASPGRRSHNRERFFKVQSDADRRVAADASGRRNRDL